MPIVSAILTSHPLADGRQSERAMVIRRGVQRLFSEMGAHVIPELSLATGRRADLVALTRTGDIWIVEIKSSIQDFQVDRKWPEYRLHSDRLFFATHPDVPAEIFPGDCGFMLSDGYGAEILREAPEHRLPPATRKAMMLRFARAGAARLLAAEIAGVSIPALEGESE
ncbi:MAG TPA: MmcB family DNA repair protein [Rhabdaerophilum sp.]|nr:MmcB family DNA repair protein [Rhabdaerophilum sp.]